MSEELWTNWMRFLCEESQQWKHQRLAIQVLWNEHGVCDHVRIKCLLTKYSLHLRTSAHNGFGEDNTMFGQLTNELAGTEHRPSVTPIISGCLGPTALRIQPTISQLFLANPVYILDYSIYIYYIHSTYVASNGVLSEFEGYKFGPSRGSSEWSLTSLLESVNAADRTKRSGSRPHLPTQTFHACVTASLFMCGIYTHIYLHRPAKSPYCKQI